MDPGKDRAPLTRTRIAEAAVTLIDAEGEGRFTMRRLAQALGVDPMAVYHHLPNKAAVVHEAIEAVLGECPLPKPTGPWPDRVRAICHAYAGLAVSHPGMFPLLCVHQQFVPSDHRVYEAVLAAVSEAGVSDRETVWAASALLGYAAGFALDALTGTHRPLTAAEQDQIKALPEAAYPATHRLMAAVLDTDLDQEFRFGIDILLAGITARAVR